MDINEETQKIGSNPVFRYAVLLLGIAILFLSQSVLTWKRTSERDARGSVEKVQYKIQLLNKEIADSDDADDKKSMREDIKELKENDLVEAQMEAAGEAVDANNGVWLWSMASLFGAAVSTLGLLIVAVTGGNHEKVGALVALGFILARLG